MGLLRRAVALSSTLILPPLALVAGRFSESIGYLYTRSWGTRRLPYFDHCYDHLRGPSNWYWLERGVFGASRIQHGAKVLDVCCGDGIYDGLFYSQRASRVDGVDRDDRALRVANRRYASANVHFFRRDVISEPFPNPPYDTIFLFAAIEHFTPADGSRLLGKIREALRPGGNFLGSTPIFVEAGGHNEEHANEFLSEADLRRFLEAHFEGIRIWTSAWPTRTEAYFESVIPET